ncbi:TPA: hypothetical protein ACGQS5_001652 [Serratia liquefaciens]
MKAQHSWAKVLSFFLEAVVVASVWCGWMVVADFCHHMPIRY